MGFGPRMLRDSTGNHLGSILRDLELTEEQDLIVGMVRRFVREEVLPLELDLDPDADELAPEDRARLIGKTKEMGLYGLDIPPEYVGRSWTW